MSVQDSLSKEQRILYTMRKVLAEIVKDTTPSSKRMRHPLSDNTILLIRECFGLISEREKELGEEAGMLTRRPRYKDEPSHTKSVPLNQIKRKANKE